MIKNILLPLKMIVSFFQALLISLKLKPRVVIGSGAYLTVPPIWAASTIGAKVILMEQNSYPGMANRLLEKKAESIHISFEDSKKYFRFLEKIKNTGNPVRNSLQLVNKSEALKYFELDDSLKTLLVIGGSLGSFSINRAIENVISELEYNNIQLIWQTGEYSYDQFKKYDSKYVKVFSFIYDMKYAFSAADLVIARSGASTVFETASLGLAVIFVPLKQAADNHQYKNAKSIVDAEGAVLIDDDRLQDELLTKISELINDQEKLHSLRKNIKSFAKPDAAKVIAEDAIALAEKL